NTSSSSTPPGSGGTPNGFNPPTGAVNPSGPAPSADTLYSNGLRDITSGKYDLARSEFQDYLKYYGDTDLASNPQFYLGETAYQQRQCEQAVPKCDRALRTYPQSCRLAPAVRHHGQ